jgi:hypothetical protein
MRMLFASNTSPATLQFEEELQEDFGEFPLVTILASALSVNRRSMKSKTTQLLVVQFTQVGRFDSLVLMYHFRMLGDQQMLLEYSLTRKSPR